MAKKIVPLRNLFPRYHRVCDCCDKPLGVSGFLSGECETAAGCFRYALCSGCADTIERKRKPARDNAMKRAIVRHAARYSEAYGRFVAEWYGVRFVGFDAATATH